MPLVGWRIQTVLWCWNTMVISCISWDRKEEAPAAIGRKHRKKALKNEKLLRKIRDEKLYE